MFLFRVMVIAKSKTLASLSVVVTERLIDHNGAEKNPSLIAQQWGILVNGLTAEPAIWKNE